jgi:hypothetical protein
MSGKIFTTHAKDSQQQLVEEKNDDVLTYKDINLENENAMGFNYINVENALENVLEDVTERSVARNELSAWKKICFAMAGLTYQMYFCVVSVFAVVFLLNSAKLPPAKNT